MAEWLTKKGGLLQAIRPSSLAIQPFKLVFHAASATNLSINRSDKSTCTCATGWAPSQSSKAVPGERRSCGAWLERNCAKAYAEPCGASCSPSSNSNRTLQACFLHASSDWSGNLATAMKDEPSGGCFLPPASKGIQSIFTKAFFIGDVFFEIRAGGRPANLPVRHNSQRQCRRGARFGTTWRQLRLASQFQQSKTRRSPTTCPKQWRPFLILQTTCLPSNSSPVERFGLLASLGIRFRQ